MNKMLLGAAAGIAATLPMTVLMLAWHKRLPPAEKYPLPPREIFDELTERAEIGDDLSETEKKNLSLAGHFAYGAVTGAIYAPLVSRFQSPNMANGVVYSLGVWTASYLGWLPALEILRPATEHPRERNALMIAAHVVWGATLGLAVGQMISIEKEASKCH